MSEKRELAGMMVSQQVFDEAVRTWPRPRNGMGAQPVGAVCANHVLIIARSMGEEPETAPRSAGWGDPAVDPLANAY